MNVARGNQGWKGYWKADRVASCAPDNSATNDAIRDAWIELLADLPDGARILDVATGNGILLSYAASAAARDGKRFALTGVDLADIDPPRYVSSLSPGLREAVFIGGVAAESLPFEADAFDAVISQYGLEYAALERALGEVARVLCAGGTLTWLAHSEDSEVVRQNSDHGEQVDLLLAPRGPLEAMGRFVAKARRRKDLAYAAQRLNAALQDAEEYCRRHPPANVVREVCTVLADTARRWQAFDPADLERMLSDSRRRLLAHRQRIEDLRRAVLSPARLATLETLLSFPAWEDVGIAPLRAGSGNSLIGLLIRARRASG